MSLSITECCIPHETFSVFISTIRALSSFNFRQTSLYLRTRSVRTIPEEEEEEEESGTHSMFRAQLARYAGSNKYCWSATEGTSLRKASTKQKATSSRLSKAKREQALKLKPVPITKLGVYLQLRCSSTYIPKLDILDRPSSPNISEVH